VITYKSMTRSINSKRLWYCSLILLAQFANAEESTLPQQPNTTVQPSSLPTMALIETQRIPSHDTLEQSKATIGKIIITRRNVFDTSKPEEDIFVFRLANAFHATTRESVIQDQLLFKPGDV